MHLKRDNYLLSMTEMILCLLPIVPIRRRSSIDPSTDWERNTDDEEEDSDEDVDDDDTEDGVGGDGEVMTMRMMRMVMVMPIRHIS